MSFLFDDAAQTPKKTQDGAAMTNVPKKQHGHNGTSRHKDGRSGKSSKSSVKGAEGEQKSSPRVKLEAKKPSPQKAKPKPVISDSESEDEIPVPAKKRALEPTVVKQEKASNPVVKEEPRAPVKKDPAAKHKKPHPPPPQEAKKAAVKVEKESTSRKRKKQNDSDVDVECDDDDDEDFKLTPKKPKVASSAEKKKQVQKVKETKAAKVKKEEKKPSGTTKKAGSTTPKKPVAATPKKPVTASKRKKAEEEKEVWKWWEEKPHENGVKWLKLEHKGPVFATPYEPLPDSVQFYYSGKPFKLSEPAEEVATFFGKMLDHDYIKKPVFVDNFWADWRKEMTAKEAAVLTKFDKCDFTRINEYFKEKSEARKQLSKEEKQKLKEEQAQIQEEYGWCMIDGHKEKIGNFKIEPPGLFRGRGEHPKQGVIKKRTLPEDVIINIGKGASIPAPPTGRKWRSVQHDGKVSWLASWTDNVQGQVKYIMLNPTSRLKGEKDWAKYETARKLKDSADQIREEYQRDWKSKEMRIRQRAVAVYFIDKLALRAGNEKDSDETADTVGCCSLRVEHIKPHESLDGHENVLEFDFLGKDSIRYYNKVPVDPQVFKNVKLFMKGKENGDDLFDRLTTTTLNKHLSELMDGLTAKVFRTYNASKTLQEQLDELTSADAVVTSKILSYNRANRAVAVLCNHQRAVPKTFDKQMSNIQTKIQAKEDAIIEAQQEVKVLKKESRGNATTAKKLESKKKQVQRLEEQLQKLEVQATDKEENKDIALGTSKLNYLDPRISVAWCKKWEVALEKVYNKTQREKFAWAIDMADETFEF